MAKKSKWKIQHCHMCRQKRWCFFTHGDLIRKGIHVMCKDCYLRYKAALYDSGAFDWELAKGVLYE